MEINSVLRKQLSYLTTITILENYRMFFFDFSHNNLLQETV